MRPTMTGVAVLVAMSMGACPREDLANRAEQAEPYLADFVRFERWARRTLSADVELRDRAAREEALFAPLLLESRVLGARIVAGEEYLFRDGVGTPEGWSGIRVGTEQVEVARQTDAVLLGRSRQVGSREVRVEMAFRPDEEP